MADFTRLLAAVETLSAKVDALLAKENAPPPPPPPPVDDQPTIDAAASSIETIIAKIP